LEARLNAQIAKSLGLDTGSAQLDRSSEKDDPSARTIGAEDDNNDAAEPAGDANEDGQEEEGFEFRLFNTAGPITKVVLEDDTAALKGEGGFVRPARPMSYYVATSLSTQQKQQHLNAAVSGEDVLLRSQQPSWGLQLPWKVTKISSVVRRAKGSGGQAGEDDADETAKQQRRPGKKRRIALRNKVRVRRDKLEALETQKLDKEEHIKDKKKRLNRLKKLRRRAKDKEKKKAGTSGDKESDDAGEDGAGQSDDASE
jgi:hypothetical protein